MTPARDDGGHRGRRPRVRNVSADLDQSALADLLREIAVPTGVTGVMLVGGAGGLTMEQLRPCQELVGFGVVPLVARGRSRADRRRDRFECHGHRRPGTGGLGSGFTHVGVVAGGTVRSPEGISRRREPGGFRGEPHAHSGRPWRHVGRETPWISAVATAVAAGAPSVTVLVNGGDIAFRDVRQSLEVGQR